MPLAALQRSKPTISVRAQVPARAAIARSTVPATTTLHPIVQAKLRIGAPDDKYEREADRVADQVMREQGLAVGSTLDSPDGPKAVQRKCAECGGSDNGQCSECEEELQRQRLPVTPPLQRKTVGYGAGANAPPIVNDALSSDGRPLDQTTRAFFEPRLGHELDSIRVHTDSKGAEAAQSINASAFTAGAHIVFATGCYRPDTRNGKELLAHELTHVIQQQAGGGGKQTIQRSVCSEQYPHDEYQPFNERRPATDKTALSQIGRVNKALAAGLANIVFSSENPQTLENCSGEGRPGYRYLANEGNNQGVLAVDLCNFGEPEPPLHPYPFLKYRFVCVAETAPEGEEPAMSTVTFHRWQNVIAVSNLGGFGSASKTLTALEAAPGYDGVTGVYSVDTGKFLMVPSTSDEAILNLASGMTTPTANRKGSHPFLAEYLRLQEGGKNLARYAGFAIPKGQRVPTWFSPGCNIPLNREMGLGFSEDVPEALRGKILEALKAEGIL
ncbi:MAG TPA: DUF4157 domain-containing protein [Terrimicrobiaceae bacterium]